MRRYKSHFVDSGRWRDFPLRDDDVIITTPTKCGTTWMQAIVGMLLLGRVDLDQQLGDISPWLDVNTRSRDEIYRLLAEQTHRRFIKTHTALDGLPHSDSVTYLAVVRHPLDTAMSFLDHLANLSFPRMFELCSASTGEAPPASPPPLPDDPGDYLRWWIHDGSPADGVGSRNLADFANQARTYWEARHRTNVHLFHYDALEADLDGEMRRVAALLQVQIDETTWSGYVEAATLDSMRSRATDLVPESSFEGVWESVEGFFKAGGRRNWPELLTRDDVEHYKERFVTLAGPDAAAWADGGRLLG